MQDSRLAKVYAKSLLDLSLETSTVDAVMKDMQLIQQICEANRDFVLMLKSPIIKGDKKGTILDEVFKDKLDNITYSFVQLLAKKGRANYLPEMTKAFTRLYKEEHKIKEVSITTAQELSAGQIAKIEQQIKQEMKEGSVEISTVVNPDIIGGIIIEVDDRLYDASVKKKLNDIKIQFLENEYIPKR